MYQRISYNIYINYECIDVKFEYGSLYKIKIIVILYENKYL